MLMDNSSGINEIMTEIGNRIKDIRIASCLTQSDLAKKSGISLSSVRRIENGQSVQFDNILSVLKAMQLISKLDIAIPATKLSPVQHLNGEKKKKIYRKSLKSANKEWEWGE